MKPLAERAYAAEPPPGWQETFDTWLRIWERSNRELDRNPWSTRANLVNHTSYRRLRELLAARAERGAA